MQVLLAVLLLCAGGSGFSAKPDGVSEEHPELRAAAWFNAPSFRIRDDRDVVLFFFKPDDRHLPGLIRQLNRLTPRPDVVVIGVTPAGRSQVERLIRLHRIRFAVAAESPSARDFGIKRTPALLRIVRKSQISATVSQVTSEELSGIYRAAHAQSEQPPPPSAQPWELQAYIQGAAPGLDRATAVGRLFARLSPEEFVEFADDLLLTEVSPDVRSRLQFYKLKALGYPVDDQVLAPAMAYERDYDTDRSGEQWAVVRAYERGLESRSAEQLAADYWEHLGDAPTDVLIRRLAIRRYTEVATVDDLRSAFMEMLVHEPDFALRGLLTSGLVQRCPVGDVAVADFLEQRAAVEPNIYHVRPWMESGAYYLRTGKLEPPRQAETKSNP